MNYFLKPHLLVFNRIGQDFCISICIISIPTKIEREKWRSDKIIAVENTRLNKLIRFPLNIENKVEKESLIRYQTKKVRNKQFWFKVRIHCNSLCNLTPPQHFCIHKHGKLEWSRAV